MWATGTRPGVLSRRLRAGLSAAAASRPPCASWQRDEKIRVFTPAEFFGVDLALSIDDGEPVTAQVVDAYGNVARFDRRSDAEALAAHLTSVPVTLDDVATVDASQKAASSLLKLSVSDSQLVVACRTCPDPVELSWTPKKAGGDRGRARTRSAQPDGGGLRAVGPVRAAPSVDGRLHALSRPRERGREVRRET